LFIAAVATVGLLAIAFAPAVYDWVGNVLNIRKRYVTVSLLANVALFAGLLYLVTVIRNTRARMNDLTRNLSVDGADPLMTDGGGDTIGVVIPAYNEEETIKRVVESL